jgi:hypothetical protein
MNQTMPSIKLFAAASFAALNALLYLLSDMFRWPMFSYFPATAELVWGWAPSNPDQGPAMYWYGWIATSMLASLLISAGMMMLPAQWIKKIPLSISWLVPTLLIPVLVYSLKYYWR